MWFPNLFGIKLPKTGWYAAEIIQSIIKKKKKKKNSNRRDESNKDIYDNLSSQSIRLFIFIYIC